MHDWPPLQKSTLACSLNGSQLSAMRLMSLCQTGSLPLQLNLFLMAFNLLLPAYPLDGGRILADLLLLCHMSEALAAKIVMVLAVVGAVGIAVWGWLSASILTISVSPVMLLRAEGSPVALCEPQPCCSETEAAQ